VHDTAKSPLPVAPAGFGVVWMLQLVPFHTSASVEGSPALLRYQPTATHALAEVHATPRRSLDVAPEGSGVAWVLQLVPFQASAQVTVGPALFARLPTALQAVEVRQETDLRVPPGTVGLGVCWTFHPLAAAAGSIAGAGDSVPALLPCCQRLQRTLVCWVTCGVARVTTGRGENTRGSWLAPATGTASTALQPRNTARTATKAVAGSGCPAASAVEFPVHHARRASLVAIVRISYS